MDAGGEFMALTHVGGKKTKHITIYALSTCPWCHKAKKLLDELGVEYDFVDVDKAPSKEREELLNIVKKWNPSTSFPTIVVDDSKCIIGFKEDQIREAAKE
jgi:glutaredoxin-like protein NrdH